MKRVTVRRKGSVGAAGVALVVMLAVPGAAGATVAQLGPSRGTSPARLGTGPRPDVPFPMLAISNKAASTAATDAVNGGSVTLGGSPSIPVANPKTDTVYVPIQCAKTDCPQGGPAGHVMDVIDAAKCNVTVTSGCAVVARAAVGKNPQAAAVDENTDTIYVADGSGFVSVVDGVHCNATVTTGCATPLATIKVGGLPFADVFDASTGTLYVASYTGGVFVIDAADCNAVTTTGCDKPVETVSDTLDPVAIDVDVATDTVYAANAGPTSNGDTLSVIDGSTCNASDTAGCAQTPRTIRVGTNPQWDVVDQATDTIYVANFGADLPGPPPGTVSVVNGATCNAEVTKGCGQTPVEVAAGAGTSSVGIDDSLHTAFVVNHDDNTLSAIDTQTCNGADTHHCPSSAPAQQATPDQGTGYVGGGANFFTLIDKTSSMYVVNAGGANTLSVVNPSACDATATSACRVDAPSVADDDDFLASVDPATDTIYVSSVNLPQIDVLDGATCRAGHLSDCNPVAEIPFPHPEANLGAIDDSTHTLYASDPFSKKVSVINTATCSAVDTAGCANVAPTVKVGPSPGPSVLDETTKTLYVPYGPFTGPKLFNKVAVVDAATCNAQNTSGCGQTPAVVTVGTFTIALGLSTKTDTVYAPSVADNNVSVIDGATCNGTNHSGCGHVAATAPVGLNPDGLDVDDSTNTVYVSNGANGTAPGTVSVIDSATCNGNHTAGCAGPFPTVAVGSFPLVDAMNTKTDTLYVSDANDAAVSVLNGATCNATVTTGCSNPAPEQDVGSNPEGLALNQNTNTVYAFDLMQPGSISIFKGS